MKKNQIRIDLVKGTILLCFIILLEIHSTAALVAERTIRSKRNIIKFESFGFDKGGTISLNGTINPPSNNVKILVCGYKSYTRLLSDPKAAHVCLDSSSIKCSAEFQLKPKMMTPITIQEKDLYSFLLVNCEPSTQLGEIKELEVSLRYKLLNPGGQQLPVGNEPLPKLYVGLTMVWVLLILTWSFYYVKNSAHRTPLHTFLGIVAVLKLTVIIISVSYWRFYAESGRRYDPLDYLRCFLYAVSETAFFCALLLIAKGWRITRSGLPPSEIRTISVVLILLLSTLLFFSFYNDDYYFLSLMIMYFFMLPKIFTSITRNTRGLDTQLMILRGSNINADLRPFEQKIRMFKTLRTAVVVYLASILMVNSLRIIRLWYLTWFNTIANEVVTVAMVWIVCYLLRPREDGLFTFDEGVGPLFDLLEGPNMMELSERPEPYDMSNTIVVEWPSAKSASGQPALIPVALCVAENSEDEILLAQNVSNKEGKDV